MRKALASAKTGIRIPTGELEHFAQEWLLDCELRQHTPSTLESRRNHLEKFFWFLENRQITDVGTPELRQFMQYLGTGHTELGGRWGNPDMTTPMRPVSMHGYYRVLRAWFNWLIEDEAIEANPFTKVPAPVHRT